MKLKHFLQQIKLKTFLFWTVSKFSAQSKFWSYNRDLKYFSLIINLKRFPGHHLSITYLQLTLKVYEATFILVYAYVKCSHKLNWYLTPSTQLYKMTSFLKIIQASLKENLPSQCKLYIPYMDKFLFSVAVAQRCSVKKVFLEILFRQACNFIKRETLAEVFFCEFSKMFKKKFSYRTPPVAASAWYGLIFGKLEHGFHWNWYTGITV